MSASGPLLQVVAAPELAGPASHFTVPLLAAHDLRLVGGKAHGLARLIAAGAPGLEVPPGLVITAAAFREFLETDGLGVRLDALCAGLAPHDGAALAQAGAAARALVLGSALPASVGAELRGAIAGLPDGPWAVRSSAIGEDSVEASFAGQLDSILGVSGVDALERAVLACWASYWSDRTLFYQLARGVRLRGMAVLVQRLVDARFAGVLFTRAGDSGMLVEYCAGLGDALVSGRINPGRVLLQREPLRVTSADKPEADAAGSAEALHDADVLRLAAVGLELEDRLGCGLDIEWALDTSGRIQLLQARPITVPLTMPPASPAPPPGPPAAPPLAAPPASQQGTTLWSNANVNENFPEPISPFLYSVAAAGYTHYFRNLARAFGISRRRIAAMEQPLNHIVGVHGARLYYNLTSIHAVLRMAPFGAALTRAFNEFVGADGVAAPPPGAATFAGRGRVRQLGELALIAVRSAWQYAFLERRVRSFETAADAFAAGTHPDRLARLSAGELLERLRGFMDIRCNRWTNAALADAASLVCYAALRRLLTAGLPPDERGSRHNTLLKALPDVVSAVPAKELWALSRMIRSDPALEALFRQESGDALLAAVRGDARFADVAAAFDRYLEAWGFRCSAELMLTLPSFQEQPAPLLELLRSYAAVAGDSPLTVMARQDAERQQETARVLALLRRRRLFRFLPGVSYADAARLALHWTQGAIIRRERARLKQALLYSRCRRIALALGERLTERGSITAPEDIFFLTVGEVDALVSGSAMFPHGVPELVALRRREHAELSALQPPDTFRLPAGEYLSLTVTPSAPAGCEAVVGSDDAAQVAGGAVLRGEGACGGQVTARAMVLGDVTEAGALAAGDVLVTRQTDPGWGPVFFLVSGLVIERGGMLSHGAIIAREFGIPCIVGVPGATRAIRSGCRVTVDGDAGEVRLHD